MKNKRVWNVEIIQKERGLEYPIDRGSLEWPSKKEAEKWLKEELEHRSKPDRYGNYPYGGNGNGGPVEIVSTRVYSTWPEPKPAIYILDY